MSTSQSSKIVDHSKHSERNVQMIARQYSGEIAWRTIIFATLVSLLYPIIILLTLTGWIELPYAIIVLTFLAYALYTPLHEAVHDNFSGRSNSLKWLNRLYGTIVATLLGASYSMHRAAHFVHHCKTNDPDLDPDNVFNESDNLFRSFIGSISIVFHEYRWFFQNKWSVIGIHQQAVFCLEATLIVGPRIAIALAGYPIEALLLTVLPNVLGIFITGFLFSYLPHRPHKIVGRYQNTVTYVFGKWADTPITWLWLYQNYHSIHHLFPRIPFYSYRKVFRQIEETMVRNNAPIVRAS